MSKMLSLFRLMLASLLAALVLSSPAYAAPKLWQVTESSGPVSVDVDGEVSPAERGQTLNPGDAIETGESGRAVIVRGGEYVIVGPKSRVRIAVPSVSDEKTQIFQSFGSALFKIEKKESWNFGVKTPYLAAVVKGTTFNVTVTDAGATVQVTEGKVEVSTLDGGAVDLMVPGRIARVDAGDRQLLKVLGTEARELRSPLPPVENSAAVIEAPASGNTATSAADNTDAGNAAAARTPAVSDISLPLSAGSADFSGLISTPIIGAAPSVSAATGGLAGGAQIASLVLDRVNAPENGNVNARGDGNDNGNGNGGPRVASGATPGTPAVPAVPAIPASGNGNAGDGAPNAPAVPAIPAVGNGNGNGNAAGGLPETPAVPVIPGAANGNAGGNGDLGVSAPETPAVPAIPGAGNGNAGGNGNLGGGAPETPAVPAIPGAGNGNAGGNGNGNLGGGAPVTPTVPEVGDGAILPVLEPIVEPVLGNLGNGNGNTGGTGKGRVPRTGG